MSDRDSGVWRLFIRLPRPVNGREEIEELAVMRPAIRAPGAWCCATPDHGKVAFVGFGDSALAAARAFAEALGGTLDMAVHEAPLPPRPATFPAPADPTAS